MADYFNIRKSFVFYGSYHNEIRNQVIHFVGIPTIFTTALQFLSKLPLGAVAGVPLNASDALAAVYALSFVKMEPLAGITYAPVIFAMHHIANHYLKNRTELAVALHVGGWIAQFIGHGVFEKRAPALLDNFFQAVHAAVFFVWLELLFALGYRPSLKKELQALIDAEIKKFRGSKLKQ